jgi:hypothetical protein
MIFNKSTLIKIKRVEVVVYSIMLFCLNESSANPPASVTEQEVIAGSVLAGYPGALDFQAVRVPRIEVINLEVTTQITPPTRLELELFAQPGSEIRPDTFRFLYHPLLRNDITDHLRSVATVTPSAVSTDKITLPAGKHQFIIIADTLGREGSSIFSTEIQTGDRQ